MSDTKIIEGKKILIVDDEPDVLETLKDLLDIADVDTATDFETAEKLMNQNKFDADIYFSQGGSFAAFLPVIRPQTRFSQILPPLVYKKPKNEPFSPGAYSRGITFPSGSKT
jgi:hypothetical protein